MSDVAETFVWERSPYTGTKKLIHLRMAKLANDAHEWQLWCGDDYLAQYANCDRKTIQRAKAQMVKDGYLEDLHERHQNGNRLYRFVIWSTDQCDNLSPDTTDTNETSRPTNETFRPDQCDNSSPPSLSIKKESEGIQIVSDNSTTFTTFWTAYPKRNGKRLYKPEAQKQWDRLSEDHRTAAFIGAGFYAKAAEEGLTIAKDCYRWLRDRCWVDWQDPAVADPIRPRPPRYTAADELAESLFGKIP